MKKLGSEVIDCARTRIGNPFRHHFKPNECQDGRITIDGCMKRGMDALGYDCSGLVIASIVEVLGLDADNWPKMYRHVRQLEQFATNSIAQPGDALLFDSREEGRPLRTHIGIYTARNCVIHSSGLSGFVEEGIVQGQIIAVRVIPLNALIGIEPH